MSSCGTTPTLMWVSELAHHRLGHHDQVLAYLYGRGLTDEDLDTWCIGYCDWPVPGTLLEGRVTFPLFGFCRSTVVAISGRVVGDALPKYWNTRFNKGGWLYGLWCAPVGRRLCLVESQMDAVALGRIGVPALATMGSSLSETQAAAVRFFTDEVVVVPHADKEQVGHEWVRVLQRQGCRAVTTMGIYPAGAPANADADWMVLHRPNDLLAVLKVMDLVLDNTLSFKV